MGNQAQFPADCLVKPFLRHQQGDLVKGGCRGVLNHAVRGHVAEEGDFLPDIVGNGRVAAADQDIRLNP